jgi:putative inorganic carbon (HCO3(-)) transporter
MRVLIYLLIFSGALIFQINGANPYLIKNEFAALFILFIIFLFLIKRNGLQILVSLKPFFYILVLLALSMALSLIKTNNIFIGIQMLIFNLLYLILFLIIAVENIHIFLKHIIYALLLSGIVVSLFGLKQYFFPKFLNPGFLALGKMQIYSTLGNPNYVASFLIACITVNLYLISSSKGFCKKTTFFLTLCIQSLCLFLTCSKTGYFAFLLALFIFMYLYFAKYISKNTKKYMGIAFCILFLIASLFIIKLNILHKILNLHTVKGRIFIWLTSLWMYKDNPFLGIGLGNYGVHHIFYQEKLFSTGHFSQFSENASFTSHAHNEFLHILVELGPLGFLLYVYLIFLIIKRGWIQLKLYPERLGFFAGFIGLLSFSIFNNQLHYAPLATNFWLFAGVLVNDNKIRIMSIDKQKYSILLKIIVFLFIFSLAIKNNYSILVSNTYERRGDILTEQGHFTEALKYFKKAVRLYPTNGYLREKYALCLFFNNKYKAALEQLKIGQRYYGDVGIFYLKAEILTRWHKYKEAIKIYQFISRAFPTHITPHFVLAQIYMQQRKFNKAKEEFQQVLCIQPSKYNLKLDWAKIKKQKEIASYFLSILP